MDENLFHDHVWGVFTFRFFFSSSSRLFFSQLHGFVFCWISSFDIISYGRKTVETSLMVKWIHVHDQSFSLDSRIKRENTKKEKVLWRLNWYKATRRSFFWKHVTLILAFDCVRLSYSYFLACSSMTVKASKNFQENI